MPLPVLCRGAPCIFLESTGEIERISEAYLFRDLANIHACFHEKASCLPDPLADHIVDWCDANVFCPVATEG